MTHIVVFFELMGGGRRYGKNLFAMFNGGRIDATRHSLKRNSYEMPIFCLFAVVGSSSSLGCLVCPRRSPHRYSSSSVSGEPLKTTPRRGEVAGVGVVDLLQAAVIVWPGIDLG
jgi:hypothetical protein